MDRSIDIRALLVIVVIAAVAIVLVFVQSSAVDSVQGRLDTAQETLSGQEVALRTQDAAAVATVGTMEAQRATLQADLATQEAALTSLDASMGTAVAAATGDHAALMATQDSLSSDYAAQAAAAETTEAQFSVAVATATAFQSQVQATQGALLDSLATGQAEYDDLSAQLLALGDAATIQAQVAATLRSDNTAQAEEIAGLLATAMPTPTATATATPDTTGARALLTYVLSQIPAEIAAGDMTWQRADARAAYQELDGGVQVDLALSLDRAETAATLSLAVFDSPERAAAYWEQERDLLSGLAGSSTLDDFPEPNVFTHSGSEADGLWVQEAVFVRLALADLPAESADATEPLSRALLSLLDAALASYDAG